MQSVVRFSLVGLLAIASLTACGDKVTVTNPPPAGKDSVVHGVTVSPSSVTLGLGGTVTLAASVDAGAGVTVRTVTWSSSDATVAAVDQTGKVTASATKAGTVTITAAATADPNVRGAAVVTVTGGGGGGVPQVLITGIQQNPGGNQVNINNAFGQIDVVLDVQTNGQTLRSVSATLTCPNNTTMTQTQTIAGASGADAEAAAIPVVLSFNTAAFNPTTGVPTLRNGPCTLTASATSGAAGAPQTATTTTQLTLNNQDGFILTNTFRPFTNAEGVSTITQANDGGGLPWRGGSDSLLVLPVLYSGRTVTSVSATLPGAAGQPDPDLTAPYTFVWSATATNGARITGQTLYDPVNFEVNGTTPKGISPAVIVIDNNGNDLGLIPLNTGVVAQTTFRIDNSPPQPPTTFIVPVRQAGWVNAAYVFTGTGVNGGFTPASGSANYVSCGDAATPNGATPAAANPPACQPQVGVSAGGVSGNTGLNGLTNTTAFPLSYYAIAAASYTTINANGTSTSATTCSTTGWTKINNAGDLAETLGNNAYVVRVFEKDALGNARCTDLAAAQNTINSGVFARGVFGVDKVAPTAAYIEPSADATAAPNNGTCGVTCSAANFFIKIGLSDNASGFSATPLTSMITRLAVNPATGAPSNAAGNFNNAFACPSGLDNNGNCTTTATSQTIIASFNTFGSADGSAASPGCVACGYFVYSQTPRDLARNAATTVTGTATPTIAGSFSAAPGQRQVVVDYTRPTVGGIAVPATLTGGSSASFATSAADNLDLISSDYTLTYSANPAGNPVANLPIRTPTGPTLGVAFDNVLTTASSFSVTTPFFIRSIATTAPGGAPQNNGAAGLPTNITVRVYDAPGNASAPGTAAIAPANVPQTNPTNFTVAPTGANPAAVMTSFQESNAAANISNCPAAGCNGGVAPVNPTSVTLTATATGAEGPTFQFLNPFTQVQFYYFDGGYAGASNEYILIGAAVAPVVTDDATVTTRTFTWTLPTPFDPPAALGVGPLRVIAVGVNSVGDALASAVNANITLTNP